jgi:uncharacterized membrane protein
MREPKGEERGDSAMLLLVLGLVIFFTVHLLPTAPELRRGLVARYGEIAFRAAFSIVALLGLALIVAGYHKMQVMPGKNPVLWDPPSWGRHVAYLLMVPAMILFVATYVPSRIRTAVKHPLLAAIKIWALAHLLANGDLASLVLFGGFLAFAVYDRISVKRRADGGRLGTRTGPPINDAVVVAAGLALFAFMVIWGHGALIGVPLMSTGVSP